MVVSLCPPHYSHVTQHWCALSLVHGGPGKVRLQIIVNLETNILGTKIGDLAGRVDREYGNAFQWKLISFTSFFILSWTSNLPFRSLM